MPLPQLHRSWLQRQATRPLIPEAVALRGACLGALGVTAVWLGFGFAAAAPQIMALGAWATVVAAVIPFVATAIAVVYAHLLNGPTGVRVVPTEWITALGSIGPVTVGMTWAFLMLQPLGVAPLVVGSMTLMAGVATAGVSAFALIPLHAVWRRAYRSDDQAAFATAVTSAALALVHMAGLLLMHLA